MPCATGWDGDAKAILHKPFMPKEVSPTDALILREQDNKGEFMSLRWDETMVLGIEEIDTQHKTIIEEFTLLAEAFQDGHGTELIQGMIAFLGEYTQTHFALEDKYMLKFAYPKIGEQREEHGEFTRDVRELKSSFDQDGASREIAFAASGKLIRWIIYHIGNHDREMVAYVLARMAAEHDADTPVQEDSGGE